MENCTNKAALARNVGCARSTLYYRPKKPKKDEELKEKILKVLDDHPAYGHKRIALVLGMNRKKILRVMKHYGIRPRVIRGKPVKSADRGNTASQTANSAKSICPIKPHVLWAGDFTYLPWHNGFVYLATVLDIHTREIVGHHIGLRHTTDLVMNAFQDAQRRTRTQPQIFHSDQGSEYLSGPYEQMLQKLNITPSHAKKSSPWENGYQESFYSQFKLELGNPKHYHSLGELAEAVHRQIHYYNNRRIHTAIKMPPLTFRLLHTKQNMAALAC